MRVHFSQPFLYDDMPVITIEVFEQIYLWRVLCMLPFLHDFIKILGFPFDDDIDDGPDDQISDNKDAGKN